MGSKLLLFVALIAGAACTKPLSRSYQTIAPKVDDGDAAKYLLPGDVIPTEYKLDLVTHIEKFVAEDSSTFGYEGVVAITINVPAEIPTITLHKHSTIDIVSAKLTPVTDDPDNPKPDLDLDFSQYVDETNKLTLKIAGDTSTPVPKGDGHIITIVFKGIHGDDMHGFYRSSYREGETDRWLVTTQFESYDARRAFPCFDEPKYKAKFTISVTISKDLYDKQYHVLSNMPLDGEPKVDDATKTVKYQFQQSAMKLSSYLVAFIVSDFKSSQGTKFDGEKLFKTWGRDSYISNKFWTVSETAGAAALDAMNKTLGIAFAYPKMDQVGIPDFSAGAMENWGLCTYRERILFFDEKSQNAATKQQIITTTVHELGHQWFGDLVTLHWWSDIWLNEGFATFFEYHAAAMIKTEDIDTSKWQIVEQMVVEEVQLGALTVDAEPTSRALTADAYAPGDIDANFDDVAYSKGGSVLRMWMHALGSDNFYAALNDYLTAKTESNGTPEDLISALMAKAAENPLLKDVDIYTNWHTLAGYPVLIATRGEQNYTVKQERFLVSGDKVKDVNWTIPISCTLSVEPDFDNTAPSMIFPGDQESIEIPHKEADWILLNIQETGYYRVNYDNETWLALTETLATDHETINNINRAQLIDDALWLARSSVDDYLSYDIALNLTNYLVNEEDLIPWKAALNGFNFLYGRLATSDSGNKLTSFISKLLEPQFERLTLTTGADDVHTTKLLRGLIASWSCKLELSGCVDEAVDQFEAEKAEIETEVRSIILCTGLRQGGADEWKDIWDLYTNAVDSAEQTMLLSALGCSKDEESLIVFLNKTLSDTEGIRKQDKSAVFSSVYNGNPENIKIALDFLSANLESISTSYGGLDPLGGLLKGLATKLGANDEEVQAMKDIVEKINTNANLKDARKSAELAMSIVNSNKAWVDKKQESIGVWLEANSASTGTFGILALLLPAIVALLNAH